MTILTPLETAQMLRVSERTVRRLPIVKTYVGGQLRYDADDVAAYVRSRKSGGVPVQIVTVAVRPAAPIDQRAPLPLPSAGPAWLVKHRNPLFAIRGKQ